MSNSPASKVVERLEALVQDLIQGGDNPSQGRTFYIAEDRKAAVAALRSVGAHDHADRVERGSGGIAEARQLLGLADEYR